MISDTEFMFELNPKYNFFKLFAEAGDKRSLPRIVIKYHLTEVVCYKYPSTG